MTAKAHADLLDNTLNKYAHNALKLAGLDIADLGEDRPFTPDGRKALIEAWERGDSIPDMQRLFRKSEARVSGELLFLAIKGKIEKRK